MILKTCKNCLKHVWLTPYILHGVLVLVIISSITTLYSFEFIKDTTVIGHSVAAEFAPTDISGLALWLQADDMSTLTLDGNSVTEWRDKSSNGLDFAQTTSSKQPTSGYTINEHNAIKFDGVDDGMINYVPSKLSGTKGYIFMALKDGTGTFGTLLASARDTANTNYFLTAYHETLWAKNSLYTQQFNTSGVSNITYSNTTDYTAEANHIYAWSSNDTAWDFRIDGVDQTVVVAGGANNGQWFGDTTLRENITLGALKRSAWAASTDNTILEVIVYDGVDLTAQNITDIETYLLNRLTVPSNTAPTAITVTGSQVSAGSSNVAVSFVADDADDDDTLEALVEYDVGAGYQKATLSEVDIDTSATFGDPKVTNAETYQVGGATGYITTSSGANTVTTIWNAGVDEPGIDVSNATIRITPYDGTIAGTSSESAIFALDLVGPNTPTNALPANNAVSQLINLTLTSSSFSESGGDTHTASQWQITTMSGDYATPIFDSGTSLTDLTSIVLTTPLNLSTKYYWHVRYQDSDDVWSSYSTETYFTTKASGQVTSTIQNPSVTINNTDTCTSSQTVVLTLSAENATEVLISDSPLFVDANWETYSSSKNYTFTDTTFAEKIVYVKYKSSTGNQSVVVTDSIFFLESADCSVEPVTIIVEQLVVVTLTVNDAKNAAYDTLTTLDGICINNIYTDSCNRIRTNTNKILSVLNAGNLETITTPTSEVEQIFGVMPGDYVQGEAVNTIYVVDKDNSGNLTKNPVLDLVTFYTHEQSISIVKKVADTTLRFFNFGKFILPKPYVVLLKFRTSDQIYVIHENPNDKYTPILYTLTNSQYAVEALGKNWPEYIVELDETFYGRFIVNGPVTSSTQITKSTMKTFKELEAMVNESR